MTALFKIHPVTDFRAKNLAKNKKKMAKKPDRELYLTTLVAIQQHFLKNTADCYQKVWELLAKVTEASYIQLLEISGDRIDQLSIQPKSTWSNSKIETCPYFPLECLESLIAGQMVQEDINVISKGLKWQKLGSESIIMLPILNERKKLKGILCLITKHKEDWELEYLQQITEAIDLYRKQEKNQIKLLDQSRQAALTSDVAFALAQSETLQELSQCCCEALLQHLEVSAAHIWVFNPKENCLELTAHAGINTPIETQYQKIAVGDLIIGQIAQNCQPYLTNNIVDSSQMKIKKWARQEDIIAFAGYPLIVETRVVGVMDILAQYPLPSTTYQTLTSISEQIALGIEHQLSQESLRKSQERYQAIVEDQTELICRFLPAGTISFVNQAFCRYFGRTREDLIGTSFIPEIVEEDQEKINQHWQAIFQLTPQKPVEMLEYRVIVNNKIRWLQWSDRAIFNQQGKIVEFQAIGHDITELVEAKEIALQASRMKSQFLATMSHEIRTPMSGVIGVVDLLTRTPLTPQQKDYIQTLKSSSQSLLSIINDILDFSKLEAQEMTLENLAFDLNTCLGEVIDLLTYQAQIKGLNLLSYYDPQVPFFLKGDPLRLRQILLNLVGNSLKFTDTGEVRIKVYLDTETNTKVKLRFEIEDTGIGISEEDQNKLFQSFSQIDTSTTRKYGGTGLGLAICKQLVELMEGEIGVKSQFGMGSVFWFTATFERPACPLPEITPENSQLRGLKVLVLDHSTSYSLIQTYCNNWGIECYQAENADTAIDSLRQEAEAGRSYDIILIDLDNPNVNGITLVQLIKADPDLHYLHYFPMVSNPQNPSLQMLINQGVNSYLTKPIRPSRLSETLNSIFETETNIAFAETSNYKILLVEDTTINQKVIANQLKILGYQVDCVNNGQEALEQLTKIDYDLVLMDCLMPILDGYETTKLIRQQERGDRHQKIIAMTANAFQENQEECLAAGMDDYISKPVTLDVLETILKRWLPDHSSGQNSSQIQGEIDPMLVPVDLEQLAQFTGGDQEFQKEVLTAFLEEAPRYIEQIKQALLNQNYRELMEKAHQLKGASNMSGIREMPKIARDLELLNSQNDGGQGLQLVQRLEELFCKVKTFILSQ